ncbi:MAG: hypothetical protein APR54_01045 [Candidatus Cloacimonas sp. SDB]|nr:MAG: hypothetical protein APR54_01045 [Candidatus Cloacimonas sp. SDB]
MKKIVLLLLLIFNLYILNSLQLNKFYHKNYGIADRTVFVFDSNLSYSIEKSDDVIKIIVKESSLHNSIKDLPLKDNPVLSCYAFSKFKNDLVISIHLNRKQSDNRDYGVEDFVLKDKTFKLVIDIFKYKEPLNRDEISSFIEFYNLVQLKEKANRYQKLLADFKEPEIAEKEISTEHKIPEIDESKKTTDQKTSFKYRDILNSDLSSLGYIIAALLFVIVIILILIIINLRKNSKIISVFQNKEKLGSRSFRKKIIKILQEAGWEDNMIAEELSISAEEVKKALK